MAALTMPNVVPETVSFLSASTESARLTLSRDQKEPYVKYVRFIHYYHVAITKISSTLSSLYFAFLRRLIAGVAY